jgi:aminocarboxymuconate-semialdehyde decarboxylase
MNRRAVGEASMIIDVHAHGLSEDFIIETATGSGRHWRVEIAGPGRYVAADYGPLDPLLHDLPGRLAHLRAHNVALQLVCPPPPLVANPNHAADAALTRRLNASTAKLVARGEGMLAGLAVPAVGEPARAADELRRDIETHGFVGVMLPSSAGERPLDDPAFAPLFAAIEQLQLFAFMHPTGSYLSAGMPDFTLPIIVGWPTETSVAVARLVFAGVLHRHPGLKLALAHGGGTLPYLLGRLDLAYQAPQYEANPACRANISHPPSHYLRQLYFDTAVSSPKALGFLIDQMGADRVLFGSDFPYEIGDADGAIAQAGLGGASPATRAAVLSGNAKRLLNGKITAI